MATLAPAPTAERRPEQIRAEIERARQEIASSVAVLSRQVSATVDWREWVRRRPEAALGLALGVGLWLGLRD